MSAGKTTLAERLRQLFGQLGSNNPHESAVARAKIDALLAKHRKTWNDLTELMSAGSKSPDPSWDVADDDRSTASSAATLGLLGDGRTPPNVLELVHFILQQYVGVKPHEYIAGALWVLHAHVFERFLVSPRLALTSPVNGCGKTTMLAVIEQLVYRPERMDNATPAVIYHLIDRLNGTLLVDEADNMGLPENSILRAVLNIGHRKGGNTRRMHKGEVRRFSTFAPMAIAPIGALPMPLMRRSIVIHMEKAAGDSGLKRFDPEDPETKRDVNVVYQFVLEWARNAKLDPNPDLPKALKNRVADNWRPLIAIADSMSPVWGDAAREAAVVFSRTYHDEDAGVVLLSDIRDIFNQTAADRIASAVLIKALLEIEESGWDEYRGPRDDQVSRKLTQGEMARLLRPFGIRPRSVWPPGGRSKRGASRKGYHRTQFESAWARYCETDGTPAHRSNVAYLGKR
jgi:hypothetical protein